MQSIPVITNAETHQYARRFIKILKHVVNETHFYHLTDIGVQVTVEHFEMLNFIHLNPGLTLSEIVEQIDTRLEIAYQILSDLVDQKLVQHQSIDSTNIAQAYYLKAQGQIVVQDVLNNQHSTVVNLFSELPIDEQVVIVQMLERALLVDSQHN